MLWLGAAAKAMLIMAARAATAKLTLVVAAMTASRGQMAGHDKRGDGACGCAQGCVLVRGDIASLLAATRQQKAEVMTAFT